MRSSTEYEYTCSECNNSVGANDKFCGHCGADLREEVYGEYDEVNFTPFEELLIRKNNPLGTSVLFILIWLANSDAKIDEKELNEIYNIADATNHSDEVKILIELVVKKDLSTIQLASEIIKQHFTSEKSKLFIEMAIGISIADGLLKISENIILRFLSDLVNISEIELKKIFYNVTLRNLPDIEDFSSYKYWGTFDESSNESKDSKTSKETQNISKRIKSLYILGLDENATLDEIKKAYRRLAHIHHPDKFASLGEEAVNAADMTFKRISEAYQYLISNA